MSLAFFPPRASNTFLEKCGFPPTYERPGITAIPSMSSLDPIQLYGEPPLLSKMLSSACNFESQFWFAFGWRSVRLQPVLRNNAIFSDGPQLEHPNVKSFIIPIQVCPPRIEHLQKTGGGTNTIYFKPQKMVMYRKSLHKRDTKTALLTNPVLSGRFGPSKLTENCFMPQGLEPCEQLGGVFGSDPKPIVIKTEHGQGHGKQFN